MAISFTTDNSQLVCAFSGRMDTLSCMKVKDKVKTKIEEHEGKVVFDMGQVDYISSSFLRLCANAATAAGNENFSIIKVNSIIKKVFMIAGFADKMNIS
jgi:anti-anti-sigma factor